MKIHIDFIYNIIAFLTTRMWSIKSPWELGEVILQKSWGLKDITHNTRILLDYANLQDVEFYL